MNKAILMFTFGLFSIITYAQNKDIQNKFFFSGKIIGQDTGIISLSYLSINDQYIHDTAYLTNGIFSFTGYLKGPTQATFVGKIKSISLDDKNFIQFFLEPTTINATFRYNDFKNAIITGSHTQDELFELEKRKISIYKEMEHLENEFNQNESIFLKDRDNKTLLKKRDSLLEKFEPFQERMKQIDFQFISKHPDSYLNPLLVWNQLASLSNDSLKMFYFNFNPSVQNSYYGRLIGDRIGGQVGHKAKKFIAIDINGETISLSKFENKNFVLLDFWATWCEPCRKNNSHLIYLYNIYHSKGLEIISIANDDDRKSAWKKAISDDKIGLWFQVLQNAGSDNDLGRKFGITPIPAKILIDKSGLIIGRYEGDNDDLLNEKLAKIFK